MGKNPTAAQSRPAQRHLEIDGRLVPYHLRRHRRARGVCMRVDPDRGLIVTIPRWLPLREVPPALQTHAAWIHRSLVRAVEIRRLAPPLVSVQNTIAVLGQDVPLVVSENGGARATVRMTPDGLRVIKPAGTDLSHIIAGWYRAHARAVFAARIQDWSLRIGVAPKRLRIGDPRSRWGSCSATGAISLSWRLLLAPPDVLDYLVVHELCHLRVHGHPARFWSLVESALPSFSESRAWLRRNGDQLHAVR